MANKKTLGLIAVVMGLLAAGAAQGVTLNIANGVPGYASLVKDAALRSEGFSGGTDLWANGNIGNATGFGSHRMYPDVGYAGNRGPRHYLTQYDVSSIPSYAIITSATMSLWFQRANSSAEAITGYKLSRLQAGKTWAEGVGQAPALDGSVTWNSQSSVNGATPAVPWATPGAAGAADIDLGTTITFNKAGGGLSEWKDFDITSWVQAWVAGTWENNGTLLWGGVGTGVDSYYGITGKEVIDGGGVDTRPKLVVTWEVPEPATLTLLALDAGLLLRRRR